MTREEVEELLIAERDAARALARELAHAYSHDIKPSPLMIRAALAYPFTGGVHKYDLGNVPSDEKET